MYAVASVVGCETGSAASFEIQGRMLLETKKLEMVVGLCTVTVVVMEVMINRRRRD